MSRLMLTMISLLAVGSLIAQEKKSCCNAGIKTHAPDAAEESAGNTKTQLPNVALLDQDGNAVHLYDDLVKDQVVAFNFIFTSCTTICPPMGAQFAGLEKRLGEKAGKDIRLISVSIDPVNDTPERLKAWRGQFKGGPGWTLLTGKPDRIESALKAMQVYTAEKNDHAPFVLLGNDKTSQWQRLNGLASPDEIMEALDKIAQPAGKKSAANKTAVPKSKAATYFTDILLKDQHGKERKLYTDLMQGKVVLIHPFFSTCKSVCPPIMKSVQRIQNHLGDQLGNQVHILSISVDPLIDTPTKLATYAEALEAKKGWFFLTGDPDNVAKALQKFGQYSDNPEGHSNVIIIGNEPTGLWKKVMGLAPANKIIASLDSVLEDKGA